MRSKDNRRESGILLPVFSLDSPYGIGTFGDAAYRFIDFLRAAGQHYWQILPLCPSSFGDSPYQSPASMAGNPYFVDLDLLGREGLLTDAELAGHAANWPADTVDYGRLWQEREGMLRRAVARFHQDDEAFLSFCEQQKAWLDDFALFMTIKRLFGNGSFFGWPEPLKLHDQAAIAAVSSQHAEDVHYYKVVQYWFFRQWYHLKEYATKQGVRLIGDLPIYVALDSADVWASPKLFRLGQDRTPTKVAGVPPDLFSSDGQLWGNPLYDWEYQKRTGYQWWIERMRHLLTLTDLIRIDHFRAFASYYTIPFGSDTARCGAWEDGPGMDLFRTLRDALGPLPIIAEDLGGNTPDVEALLRETAFPNMKVLQFAFDGGDDNPFLPANYDANCVCYTGTHDNDTTMGWYASAPEPVRARFREKVSVHHNEPPAHALIRYAMKSRAQYAIIPLQDYLCLGSEARINLPSTLGRNWQWRISPGTLDERLIQTVKRLSAR